MIRITAQRFKGRDITYEPIDQERLLCIRFEDGRKKFDVQYDPGTKMLMVRADKGLILHMDVANQIFIDQDRA